MLYPEWPATISAAGYAAHVLYSLRLVTKKFLLPLLLHVRCIVQLALSLHAAPEGDSRAERHMRLAWWPALAEPPIGSPYG